MPPKSLGILPSQLVYIEYHRNLGLFGPLAKHRVQSRNKSGSAQPWRTVRRLYMLRHKITSSPHLRIARYPKTHRHHIIADQDHRRAERRVTKEDMRGVPSFYGSHATSRIRPVVTTLLFVLCIPMFFYHLVPGFTRATDELISRITTRIHAQESFCTKEVGDAKCCGLYLTAQPCLDECREQYVDRVTYTLTQEYDECAEQCLLGYHAVCQMGQGRRRHGR